ncbi:hypothetical protein [Arthrobacter sp. UYEF20]|uniref:hypothetical protein n=1 Tax=Arthrobacter sp. UYEF20 TaxID=1756363 RepID=UPI0033962448
MGYGRINQQGRAVRVAGAGLMIITAYALTGTLQILVWNPLAAVPGATLDEIHAGLHGANESLAAPVVIAWAISGMVLAALVLIRALTQSGSRVKDGLVLDLLLLVLAAPSHWFAAFPAGMGLADAFATRGGDHTPWGMVLYGVSAVALAALVAMATIKSGKAPRA